MILHEKNKISTQALIPETISFVLEAEKVGDMMILYDAHFFGNESIINKKYQDRILVLH